MGLNLSSQITKKGFYSFRLITEFHIHKKQWKSICGGTLTMTFKFYWFNPIKMMINQHVVIKKARYKSLHREIQRYNKLPIACSKSGNFRRLQRDCHYVCPHSFEIIFLKHYGALKYPSNQTIKQNVPISVLSYCCIFCFWRNSKL